MKLSLNGIGELGYPEIVDVPVDELVKKIGAQLGEIEEVIKTGDKYQGIVVAEVVSCVKHPNADKLQICKIDDGQAAKHVPRDHDGYVQVVCGAPNVRKDLLVAWLPPGVVVPSTYDKEKFELSAREIRGVVSNGMLASAAELAIGDDHDGLLENDPQHIGEALAKPGVAFKQLYGLDDVIIDIENKMFTHRPDLFGQLGIARELAGIQGKKFVSPDWYTEPKALETKVITPKKLKVTNEIPELVPRYMAVVVDGVKIGKSPLWLQSYLSRLGLRPINNIVDMTNFVMMVTGQPLHAFDYNKVVKDNAVEIVVRKPHKGEKITLLDGKTITPRAEAILIADAYQPIALGGAMGGNNSEIDDSTTTIIIECASFDMYNIRRTSMEHGLFSEAVTRFTKGQSPWQCPAVLAYAVDMTEQLSAGSHLASAVVDSKGKLKANPAIAVTPDFINDRLGLALSAAEISKLLVDVEFSVAKPLTVTAPFWRTDIAIPEDIVEEVGRLIGYDHLPVDLPKRDLTPANPDPKLSFKKRLREILSKAGANEVLTYSFVHGGLLEKAGQDAKLAFELSNALSPDLQYYRMSIMPSLLDKVHGNIKAGYDQFVLFELGKVHNKLHADDDKDDPGLPTEIGMLALVFAANDKAARTYAGAPYYQARKYLDYLAAQLGLPLTYTPMEAALNFPVMNPYDWQRTAIVTVTGTKITLGCVGEFRPSVLAALKLPAFSAGFEIGPDQLLEALEVASDGYVPLAKYPRTSQDVSFKVASDVTYASIAGVMSDGLAVAAAEHGYECSLEALDIYQAAEGVKHVAFRVTLWHFERTLKTSEVSEVLSGLGELAKRELKAERI